MKTDHSPDSPDFTERTEKRFWKKIKTAFTQAGEKGVYAAFILYLTIKAEETPAWAKGVILGALGYFISLVDAIPDLTPVLGYTDDVSLMLAAISAIAGHITPQIRQDARRQTEALLGKALDADTEQFGKTAGEQDKE